MGKARRKTVGSITLFLGALILSASALAAGAGPAPSPAPKCAGDARAKAEGLNTQAMQLAADKFDEATLKKAIGLSEQAVQVCPSLEQGWINLAGWYWQIGDWLAREQKDARISWFTKGEAAADKAIAINPKSAGGLFWKGTNMASAADMKGWASSLWMFPALLKTMDAVDAIDPHWELGATKRFWTEVLSRVPLFLANRFGYKPEDIARDLEGEIKREPRYFANYVYAARLYWKLGEKDKALSLLSYPLTHNPADYPPKKAENEENQRDARRMWKEYTGKDYPNK